MQPTDTHAKSHNRTWIWFVTNLVVLAQAIIFNWSLGTFFWVSLIETGLLLIGAFIFYPKTSVIWIPLAAVHAFLLLFALDLRSATEPAFTLPDFIATQAEISIKMSQFSNIDWTATLFGAGTYVVSDFFQSRGNSGHEWDLIKNLSMRIVLYFMLLPFIAILVMHGAVFVILKMVCEYAFATTRKSS